MIRAARDEMYTASADTPRPHYAECQIGETRLAALMLSNLKRGVLVAIDVATFSTGSRG